jgi:hypothetical protein
MENLLLSEIFDPEYFLCICEDYWLVNYNNIIMNAVDCTAMIIEVKPQFK